MPLLPSTDISTIEVGERVLCFQPPDGILKRDHLLRILRPSGGHGVGWWVGRVEGNSNGWVQVRGTQGANVYDGGEYPVYRLSEIPPLVEDIFRQTGALQEMWSVELSPSLEDEFFEREGTERNHAQE